MDLGGPVQTSEELSRATRQTTRLRAMAAITGDDEGSDDEGSDDEGSDDEGSDGSCEDVWDGAMEPGETEGDIHEVDNWLVCNFNILGIYTDNSYTSFTYSQGSVSGMPTSIRRCFDDAGTTNIDQDNVDTFEAGPNSGWFIYDGGDGYQYKHYFEEGEIALFDPPAHIYEVHID
jgi:hypothetical protein